MNYGVGDKRTTFNIPDYRGFFLRGWDYSNRKNITDIEMDSTKMPTNQLVIKAAGLHSHAMTSNGEHKHQMNESGLHKHAVEMTGNHTHKTVEQGRH